MEEKDKKTGKYFRSKGILREFGQVLNDKGNFPSKRRLLSFKSTLKEQKY